MKSLKIRLKISDERLEAVTDVINAHYDSSATDAEVYHYLDWGWDNGEKWIESATTLDLVHWVKYRLPNADFSQDKEKDIYETTETDNYLVVYNDNKSRWELRRKVSAERSIFMKSSKYQTPLIVAANAMERHSE